MQRIDILVGENLYDSTSYFAKQLKLSLEKLGVQVRLFWIDEGCFYQAFYEISRSPPDLTCSFSDIYLGDHKPLGECWHIPHLSILIDPAIYYLHQMQGRYGWVSCVDEFDLQFVRDDLQVEKAFFLPHGVSTELVTPVGGDRPYECVFFGSCFDIDKQLAKWEDHFDQQTQSVLKQASQMVLSQGDVSALQALLSLSVEQQRLPELHHEVDQYIRGKDRIELVRALKKRSVHIWGEGPWARYCPDAVIHPAQSYEKTLEVMKKAQWVLNSSPRFKRGSHERIFAALAAGCGLITGESTYIQKSLQDGVHLITYSYGRWEELVDKLSVDPKELAVEGQRVVMNKHSWDVRAETLLSEVEKLKNIVDKGAIYHLS